MKEQVAKFLKEQGFETGYSGRDKTMYVKHSSVGRVGITMAIIAAAKKFNPSFEFIITG